MMNLNNKDLSSYLHEHKEIFEGRSFRGIDLKLFRENKD
jgi:hypothetical protein